MQQEFQEQDLAITHREVGGTGFRGFIFSSELLLFSSMGVQGLEMSTMWTSVYLTTALQHILYTQLIHPG